MKGAEEYRYLRLKIRRAKYNWLAEMGQDGSKFAGYLLRRKGRYLCEVKSIAEQAEETIFLFDQSPQTRISPDFGTHETLTEKTIHSSLNAYFLKDTIASAKTNLIEQAGVLLVPNDLIDQRDTIEIDTGAIGFLNPHYAYRFDPAPDLQENAILIGGNGSSNWYHFVLEIAPKAFMANFLPAKFDKFPLIVPFQAQTDGPFAQILQALLPNRSILTLRCDSVRVRNLVTFDEVSHGPFNLIQGSWPKLQNYSQHETVLKLVFQKLRAVLLPSFNPARKGRRVFIVRPDKYRKYNQMELLQIASKYNFEPVSPETHSLAEQAQIFAEASHVVGASGAAWTNMIFAQKPFKALTWIIPQYSQFCS